MIFSIIGEFHPSLKNLEYYNKGPDASIITNKKIKIIIFKIKELKLILSKN